MSASTPDGGLIDFHSHYYEQEWSAFPAHQKPGVLLQAWPLLTDIDGQLAAMDTASVFHTTMNGVIGLSPEQKEKLKIIRQSSMVRSLLLFPCAGYMRHLFKESLYDTDSDAFQTPFFEQTFQVASTALMQDRFQVWNEVISRKTAA